jgi:hypothetical protein
MGAQVTRQAATPGLRLLDKKPSHSLHVNTCQAMYSRAKSSQDGNIFLGKIWPGCF